MRFVPGFVPEGSGLDAAGARIHPSPANLAVATDVAKDFENLAETLATFVTLASIQPALRRLAKAEPAPRNPPDEGRQIA